MQVHNTVSVCASECWFVYTSRAHTALDTPWLSRALGSYEPQERTFIFATCTSSTMYKVLACCIIKYTLRLLAELELNCYDSIVLLLTLEKK